jgi:thioredoxin reductase
MVNIAIIGAGPYGLSIAAHLRAQGIDFRIFGSPMQTWRTQMPKGMRLKSEGFASSLYDPASTLTLAEYCRRESLPYADTGLPVPLETFCSYGLKFQQELVPGLEDKHVLALRKTPAGFEIDLADGETVAARKVVVAVGLSYFDYVPPTLSSLPKNLMSHSSECNILDRFKGQEVAVVGAGASALDLAALLHEAGASVQLVARKPAIRFHDPPGPSPRPLLDRLRSPMTGIGPGWKLFFCANMPQIFRHLPESDRLRAVKRILGPAPGWFVRDQVVGKMPFHLGFDITQASVQNGRVNLQVTDAAGSTKSLAADHLIAATGYRVDLRRISFLNQGLRTGIRDVEHAPVLSANFESSVPGLYFVGTSAANTFGPLMRFAVGARFASRQVSKHLARVASSRVAVASGAAVQGARA